MPVILSDHLSINLSDSKTAPRLFCFQTQGTGRIAKIEDFAGLYTIRLTFCQACTVSQECPIGRSQILNDKFLVAVIPRDGAVTSADTGSTVFEPHRTAGAAADNGGNRSYMNFVIQKLSAGAIDNGLGGSARLGGCRDRVCVGIGTLIRWRRGSCRIRGT